MNEPTKMTREDYLHLQAERTFLRRQLERMPADAKITRISAENRLREVEATLATMKFDAREPARARLTFRGRPVVGSYGVFAEFGLKATTAFADAVSKVAAASAGPLAPTGPVPGRDQNQLLITRTAVGSFGFELEEHQTQSPTSTEESSTAQALAVTLSLLRSTQGTDDELAEAASATDPRALGAVRSFLQLLADNDAVCTLEYRDEAFRFPDVGAVRSSLARISQDNLFEEETELEGEFQGVLPKRRTFEFRLAGDGSVINGKISPTVIHPEVLNEHLNEAIRIKVTATRVGSGRPRYVLSKEPDWSLPNK